MLAVARPRRQGPGHADEGGVVAHLRDADDGEVRGRVPRSAVDGHRIGVGVDPGGRRGEPQGVSDTDAEVGDRRRVDDDVRGLLRTGSLDDGERVESGISRRGGDGEVGVGDSAAARRGDGAGGDLDRTHPGHPRQRLRHRGDLRRVDRGSGDGHDDDSGPGERLSDPLPQALLRRGVDDEGGRDESRSERDAETDRANRAQWARIWAKATEIIARSARSGR